MTVYLARGQAVIAEDLTAEVLAGVRPDRGLEAELEALYGDSYEAAEDASPVDAGNSVDGEPWGWFRTLGGPDDAFVPGDSEMVDSAWRLVPLLLGEFSENMVTFSAWQSGSMTGASLSSGATVAGDVAIVWTYPDEDPRSIDVIYGDVDVDKLAVSAVDDVLDVLEGYAPLCPEEVDEHGWVMTLGISDRVSEAIVARALGLVWRPCQRHNDAIVEVSGKPWQWSRGRWERDTR